MGHGISAGRHVLYVGDEVGIVRAWDLTSCLASLAMTAAPEALLPRSRNNYNPRRRLHRWDKLSARTAWPLVVALSTVGVFQSELRCGEVPCYVTVWLTTVAPEALLPCSATFTICGIDCECDVIRLESLNAGCALAAYTDYIRPRAPAPAQAVTHRPYRCALCCTLLLCVQKQGGCSHCGAFHDEH